MKTNLHKSIAILTMLLLFGNAAFTQVSTTFSRFVTSGNDDAEQRISNSAMDLTSSDLEITTDGSNNQLIGIRFANISIPKGIIIDSAFIQFATKGDKAPISGVATIRAELSGNSATFTATASNISARTLTTNSVNWAGSTDSTWGTCCTNFRGSAQRTSDIKTIIQDAINQSAWNTNNPVTIVMNGSGVRNAQSFNGSSANAPELIIYYQNNTYSPGIFPITKGSVWKYRDNGIFPGSTWKDSTFNDSIWTFKQGKFGYGDTARTTVVFGPDSSNKYVTTYFRNKFAMSNTAGFDTLIFRILRDDGAVVYINGVEAFRSNMPTGTITDSTLALSAVNGADENTYFEFRVPNTLINGINTIAVEVHQHTRNTDDMGFDMEVTAKRVPMAIVNFPVAKNAEWSYLDDGTDQGTAWRASTFNDGNWNYGSGKLGYGDPAATVLGFGPNSSNKYITYYFRKKFNVPSLSAISDSIIVSLLRDDGAVVYINGNQIFRSNMPDTGVINYLTWSSTTVDGADETRYFDFVLPKSVLVNGINTIAVEVHQRDGASSDLGFDLEIKQDPRLLNLTAPTAGQSIPAGQNFNINWYHIPTINKVKIELSTDNRASWTTLINNLTATDKPYSWSVPNINSSVSWLRISDSTNTFIDSVNFWIYPVPAPFNPCLDTLHIGCFASVSQTRNQVMKIPTTHRLEQIARQGQTLSLGGGNVGGNLDYTGFMAFNNSSKRGALGVNEENTPGGVSVFYVRFDTLTGTWLTDSSGRVNLSAPGLVQSTRNCSGGNTPWGTIITSEESFNTGDVNADGYEDVGWHVEYNPWTRQVMDYNSDGIRDKLWAMGRMNHENVVVKNDSLTAYYGEDGGTSCLYKFVAFQKMRLDSGLLYVMQRTGTTGNWVLVPNGTQAQRNTIPSIASGLGGTNFNGIEDVEINPINGMIYFTSKNNSIIYRFTDNGTTASNFENYVGNSAVNYSMNVEGGGTQSVNWGGGIDNINFDNRGNLWAHQDGGNGHLWVIRPDHTPFAPKVDLFGTTPTGSESGGLTFTPDYRYGFYSIMGASTANTTPLIDAAGVSVVFNTSNTLVIANRNFLGALAAVPVEFSLFNVNRKQENNAEVKWETSSETNNSHFVVERSVDGINYKELSQVKGAGNSRIVNRYTYTDFNLKPAIYYYRIKQVDFDGKQSYSGVRSINLLSNEKEVMVQEVYPNPFNTEISILANIKTAQTAQVQLFDVNGKLLISQNVKALEGRNNININTTDLKQGIYTLKVITKEETYSQKLIK